MRVLLLFEVLSDVSGLNLGLGASAILMLLIDSCSDLLL